MDEALPKCSEKYGRMASKTSGRTGVVALLSKYTRRMACIHFTPDGAPLGLDYCEAAVRGNSAGGLSVEKLTLRYSMIASRSAGATCAPHLAILSTSLVHAALLRRCCVMMLSAWQAVQAVATLSLIGGAEDTGSGDCACSPTLTTTATAKTLSLNMDLDLIVSVVEVSARVPDGGR